MNYDTELKSGWCTGEAVLVHCHHKIHNHHCFWCHNTPLYLNINKLHDIIKYKGLKNKLLIYDKRYNLICNIRSK